MSLYNFLESVKHTHLGREVSFDTGKIWRIPWSAPWHAHMRPHYHDATEIFTLQHTAVTWRLLPAEEPFNKPDLDRKLWKQMMII